ncbi:secretory phospholipase A2 receptor isoform X1 [Lepisosteus oculatus]|uniref:secretory phospholipase A2 receptor isoform X1 n=1 Tax=Lepisosteus oculatus TaxID=7918 RepID=UPI0035F52EA8
MKQYHFVRVKVGALAVLFPLLFMKSCKSAADEDVVLDQNQLSEHNIKGIFILQSVQFKSCIKSDKAKLILENCENPSKYMLWKWVSRHRLFNVGSSMCLGLNTTNAHQPLNMYECDSTLTTLWWRCSGNTLFGAAHFKLTTNGRLVIAKRTGYHQWKRYLTLDEGPCSRPYEEIHTVQGNAHGMPCVFPFKYNNKWYSECTAEGREDNYRWCATTSQYDQDEKWGFCPSPETGCDVFWEKNQDTKACYQFNLYSILSWNQAHASCQAQGGNLLSITDLTEQRYIRERLNDVGVLVWIGLNHLDETAGWQWSDGAPLALVNFTTDISMMSRVNNAYCGVYNSVWGHKWHSLHCRSALPYICKKNPNYSRTAELFDVWQYYPTECAPGWIPHNRFCYKRQAEEQSWEDSLASCHSLGANLISIHSLADVELSLNLFKNISEAESDVWIGLNNRTSYTFQWSNGSPVTFTNWYKYEPNISDDPGKLCVKAKKAVGNWQLASCAEKLPSVCKKTGNVIQQKPGILDEDCPEGWKRRGSFCYNITRHLQTYEDASQGYYCNAPLVIVENRYEQAFLKSLLYNVSKDEDHYFWIALQDRNRTGEYSWLSQHGFSQPLLFTNWNKYQPVSSGGCVAMSAGTSLGRWEVKDCETFKAMSICKKPISTYNVTQSSTINIDQRAPCPPGWTSKPELLHCYKVYHSEKILMKRTWEEADAFCQDLGANLASFNHYEEEIFLNEILQNMFDGNDEDRWFWVGFNKRNPRSDGAWEWSDGTPVVSSFIDDKNNEDDKQNCAVYRTNMVMPQRCDAKHEWICKMPKGVELKRPYWYTEQNEPWVFYKGSEYYFDTQSFPWETVSFACTMMGAELVSIQSSEEINFIKTRIEKLSQNDTKWWIGLFPDLIQSEFRWRDGSPLYYENWEDRNSRRSPLKNDQCVYMASHSGRWSEGKCSDHYSYICKRRTVSVVEIPREPHHIGACPEKWLYFGHNCILINLPSQSGEGKNWSDAQAACKSLEGSLISIDNEIEQAYVTMLLIGGTTSVWIGLQDDGTNKWVNGKPVTYTNWSPIEPESFDPNEDDLKGSDTPLCTLMSNNHNYHLSGKWYNQPCLEHEYGFVCQKPQDPSKPPSQSYFHPLPETIEYKNRSYRVIHGNMTWYEALNKCLEKESELVSITDEFHQAFLTVIVNKLAHPHWIGLYSQDQNGISYQWSDGSASFFTHWDDDDNDEHLLGDCVYMDINGKWKRADCETPLRGAVCHELLKSEPISFKTECPKTWVKFQSSCYSFEPVMMKLSLEDGQTHCRQKANGSDILTIKNEEENRFVLEELKTFELPHQTVWLGITYDTDNDALEWFNGSPIKYSNWPFGKGPEADILTVDSCVSVRLSDGIWQLSHCNEKLGFICKIHGDVSNEIEIEPLKGVHQGMIPVAVLVAILIFVVLVGSLWCVYKRNVVRFRRLSSFGNAYYHQAGSEATDSDGSILITDFDSNTGQ